jgi:hypothetical protein
MNSLTAPTRSVQPGWFQCPGHETFHVRAFVELRHQNLDADFRYCRTASPIAATPASDHERRTTRSLQFRAQCGMINRADLAVVAGAPVIATCSNPWNS